jgi:hypothetical protein
MVQKHGTGSGSVTSAPVGINCGGDCEEDYNLGTVVTLSASADAGSTFAGWSGENCSGAGACVAPMDRARTVRATFDIAVLPQYTLTVQKSGAGTGTVTSDPGGIDCGGDCDQEYDQGTPVTLSAQADSGSVFTGWSGAGCAGSGTCQVTMDAARSVTATFELEPPRQPNLTVLKSGTGTGTVMSDPEMIDCGADCEESCQPGEVVTLFASAHAGCIFDGWSGGGCTGTGNCTLTMDGDKTVTAAFTTTTGVQYDLSVIKTGGGKGKVISTPSGVYCGVDCEQNYNTGTAVTLEAFADADSRFTGWSGGGCTGTGPCLTVIDAHKSVTATFERDDGASAPFPVPTLTYSGLALLAFLAALAAAWRLARRKDHG